MVNKAWPPEDSDVTLQLISGNSFSLTIQRGKEARQLSSRISQGTGFSSSFHISTPTQRIPVSSQRVSSLEGPCASAPPSKAQSLIADWTELRAHVTAEVTDKVSELLAEAQEFLKQARAEFRPLERIARDHEARIKQLEKKQRPLSLGDRRDYGTTLDQAEVLPDSNPSSNTVGSE